MAQLHEKRNSLQKDFNGTSNGLPLAAGILCPFEVPSTRRPHARRSWYIKIRFQNARTPTLAWAFWLVAPPHQLQKEWMLGWKYSKWHGVSQSFPRFHIFHFPRNGRCGKSLLPSGFLELFHLNYFLLTGNAELYIMLLHVHLNTGQGMQVYSTTIYYSNARILLGHRGQALAPSSFPYLFSQHVVQMFDPQIKPACG